MSKSKKKNLELSSLFAHYLQTGLFFSFLPTLSLQLRKWEGGVGKGVTIQTLRPLWRIKRKAVLAFILCYWYFLSFKCLPIFIIWWWRVCICTVLCPLPIEWEGWKSIYVNISAVLSLPFTVQDLCVWCENNKTSSRLSRLESQWKKST